MPFEFYIRLACIVFVMALFPAGFVTGCLDEKERFDAYRTKVDLAGEAQESRTRARIALDNLLREEADSDHHGRIAALTTARDTALASLRDARRGSSIVPRIPEAPGSSDRVEPSNAIVCFGADRLRERVDAELARFEERTARSVLRGATAIATSETCTEWAMKEWQGR